MRAELRDELVALVRERVGPVACFRDARVVARLPKTRSGKILRSTMRDIAAGRDYALPATIDDPAIIDEIAGVLGTVAQCRLGSGRGYAASPGAPVAAREACAELGDVEVTRAHGCDAVAAGGRAYALIARGRPRRRAAARLGSVRRRLRAARERAAVRGRASASATGCCCPEDVRDDPDALRVWLRHAHALTAGRV